MNERRNEWLDGGAEPELRALMAHWQALVIGTCLCGSHMWQAVRMKATNVGAFSKELHGSCVSSAIRGGKLDEHPKPEPQEVSNWIQRSSTYA